MKHIALLAVVLSLTLSIPVGCGESGNPVSSHDAVDASIVLINGVLIDAVSPEPLMNSTVIIHNDHIEAVGEGSSLDVPDGARILDVQGSYILPGFANAHVHEGYDENNLKEWARSGVTTVRDLGAFTYSPTQAFELRDNLLADSLNARLVAAGPMVTAVGGYGNYPVASADDAEEKVDGLINDGADLIKVAIEDNLQGRRWPMLSVHEIERIAETAHRRTRLVSAHISRSMHLAMAIEAGVDDVAHMVIDNLPDSLISRMVENDIYWVPTLELWAGVSDRYGLDWDVRAKNNLRRFVQAGGRVALGTDFGGYVTPFESGMPLLEMRLMREAGMTPMQVIIAGTRHAAHVCGRESVLGSIEEGKIADVIVVKDNPLDDIQSLSTVKIVIHNGKIVRLSEF